MPVVPDSLGHLESHFHRELTGVVHDRSRCTNLLTQREDEHLLDDPTPESPANHKQAVEGFLLESLPQGEISPNFYRALRP
jgi:hypothetical protein